MALEFRTRDESYKGPSVLPSRAVISQASVFVDHLPPGFSTDHYNPHLVKDRYSHRPRYIIDTMIMIESNALLLTEVSASGLISTNPTTVQLILNTSIERDGLDILLIHHGHEYQGTVYPIPELIAEADQHHKTRQRPRTP
jgi:hypothetical protein